MDKKDRNIVRALQKDGRITNQALANKVSLSASPCLRRLRNLEKSGVIRSYSASVDPRKYGLSITSFVSVRLDRHTQQSIDHFESQIQNIAEVLACYLLTGSQDYLLHVVSADLDSYNDFVRHKLHRIGGIASIDSSISYSTIKQTSVFPVIDE